MPECAAVRRRVLPLRRDATAEGRDTKHATLNLNKHIGEFVLFSLADGFFSLILLAMRGNVSDDLLQRKKHRSYQRVNVCVSLRQTQQLAD